MAVRTHLRKVASPGNPSHSGDWRRDTLSAMLRKTNDRCFSHFVGSPPHAFPSRLRFPGLLRAGYAPSLCALLSWTRWCSATCRSRLPPLSLSSVHVASTSPASPPLPSLPLATVRCPSPLSPLTSSSLEGQPHGLTSCCAFPPSVSGLFPRRSPASVVSRRFFYYRFHKRIGKGSFNRYVEFYQKPRGIENTLRLRFNYRPTFTEKKRSELWRVNLLKKIAQATDSKQVLDVWVYYRHKRHKCPYHYLIALRRLVELGGCDPTDFRFRVLANAVHRAAKRFINLPRVCVYLAKLRATGDLQDLSRFLLPQVPAYFPHQLCLVAHAFGTVKLQDKHLFAAIDEATRPYLAHLPAAMLLKLTQGYADSLIHNYGLLARVSLVLQQRVFQAALRADECYPLNPVSSPAQEEEDEVVLEDGTVRPASRRGVKRNRGRKDVTSGSAPQNGERRAVGPLCPSLDQLVQFGRVFSVLKFQDFGYFEMLSQQMQTAFRACASVPPGGRAFSHFTPFTVQTIVEVMHRLKINDIPLLLAVLNHVGSRLYDYPPVCLASIGLCSAQMLPCREPHVRKTHEQIVAMLEESIPNLDLDSVQRLTALVKKSRPRRNRAVTRERIFKAVEARVLELSGDGETIFDVGRLLEVLSSGGRRVNVEVFAVICQKAHRHLDLFEPVDFCRLARTLARIRSANPESTALVNLALVNALARRALRQQDEFSARDFLNLDRWLNAAGPPERVYQVPLKQQLRQKQIVHGYFPHEAETVQEALPPITTTDLPVASRRSPVLRRGRLVLGKAALARHGKSQVLSDEMESGKDDGSALSGERSKSPASLETVLQTDGTDEKEASLNHSRRKRLEERLRIAEEEGWNLLHRRVASLRQLKGWL
ncbi:hypothetical protein CSUI_001611 [Cystoisospora suis]|uniref:Uncharacterized protein n=1 Tax=Cystoisospora suis TaxID=483139 RepID=A0A2C6KWW3_9APIC|nr:hypothetical protein CSUI_001611 [Cystoisospora suis]